MSELNSVVIIFFALYIGQTGFSLWIERLNALHLKQHGNQVPEPFQSVVDSSKLSKISSYTLAKSRMGVLQEIVHSFLLLGLIVSGFLSVLARILDTSFDFYLAAWLFFFIPGLILHLSELPFDYLFTFVIEEKFGFNRRTFRLWVMDQLKSGAITIVLFSGIFFSVIWMIRVSPNWWWFWGFLMISVVQIVLVVIYPTIIAPLFNKFEPIGDENLSDRIQRLVEENGIRVKRILQMNAGLRSRHTNAYFSGFGRTKQIVLFDTLLESHTQDEIISVLAHEIGHYKKKHIIRGILTFEVFLLAGFYLTHLAVGWPGLYTSFGFEPHMTYAGLFLVIILCQKAGFFLLPLHAAISRKFEREADRFAVRLIGTSAHLVSALTRMGTDNLSNLAPHPLYVHFHYSHPPLLERIELLRKLEREMAG
jgi:STE24 endopeptidase